MPNRSLVYEAVHSFTMIIRIVHLFKRFGLYLFLCACPRNNMADATPSLSTSFSELIADNCSIVAGLALLIWDALICLSEEKRQVWERKITGASILYFLIRYGGIFEYAVETVDISPFLGVKGY
ncbi:hypothetical protein BDP27DRAFT_434773 [Rhodocollybia butyracea]|uniref:DUF6533 domain-containing protein n=1 Tax=Rhodocollybia butyracea TaxID=206335 RepID=A0A9P5PTR5_9AGAR|nr:hypothetical protein BDP27DRAFT_434773 [Rhodocollybia butyracea]